MINIGLTRISPGEINEATKRNMNKCPQCNYGLMRDTAKGILPIYVIPPLYLVTSILAAMRAGADSDGNRRLKGGAFI